MSDINLRQEAEVSVDDNLLNRPLSNAEVDTNFINLNQDKLEKDGSIEADFLILSDQGSITGTKKIWYDSGNSRFVLNGDLRVDGNFTSSTAVTPTITTTDSGIALTLDNGSPYQITSIAEADGGGIRIGDIGDGSGYVRFLYNHSNTRFEATANGGATVNVYADNVMTNTYNLNAVGLKAGSALSASSTNTSNISALQTRVAGLETAVGTTPLVWSNTSTDNATEEPVIADDPAESIYDLLDKINTAMLNVISEVRHVSATSLSASSGVMYIITPTSDNQGGTGVFNVSLPTSNKGRIVIRFDDAGFNGNVIRVESVSGNLIEDLAISHYVQFDTNEKYLEFVWDSSSSVWRVILPATSYSTGS